MTWQRRLRKAIGLGLLLTVLLLVGGLTWLYWRNHAQEDKPIDLIATWTAQTCGTSRPGLVVDSVLTPNEWVHAGEELEIAGEHPPQIRGRRNRLRVLVYRFPRAWDPKGCYRRRVELQEIL